MSEELICHDTGPDGDSTTRLVVGEDIDRETAQKLVALNNGTVVYSMHVYEHGVRSEQFVPKHIYDGFRATVGKLPQVRSIDEIRNDMRLMEEGTRSRGTVNKPKPRWWQFWK